MLDNMLEGAANVSVCAWFGNKGILQILYDCLRKQVNDMKFIDFCFGSSNQGC